MNFEINPSTPVECDQGSQFRNIVEGPAYLASATNQNPSQDVRPYLIDWLLTNGDLFLDMLVDFSEIDDESK